MATYLGTQVKLPSSLQSLGRVYEFDALWLNRSRSLEEVSSDPLFCPIYVSVEGQLATSIRAVDLSAMDLKGPINSIWCSISDRNSSTALYFSEYREFEVLENRSLDPNWVVLREEDVARYFDLQSEMGGHILQLTDKPGSRFVTRAVAKNKMSSFRQDSPDSALRQWSSSLRSGLNRLPEGVQSMMKKMRDSWSGSRK